MAEIRSVKSGSGQRKRDVTFMCQGGDMSTEENFHALVSDLDYPMFIVVAATRTERAGCLVGFVTQASIDPPRLLIMLSKLNRTCHVAQAAETLIVHFLIDNNHDLATLFGQASGDDTDKFAECEWNEGPGGTPILIGTRGWVAGRILDRFDAGDHIGHLVDVREAQIDTPGAPLAYQTVRGMEAGHPA
jgi:flavin reductase (DIM6/NTAB) family NADH-FMN oxidoreductase RutF